MAGYPTEDITHLLEGEDFILIPILPPLFDPFNEVQQPLRTKGALPCSKHGLQHRPTHTHYWLYVHTCIQTDLSIRSQTPSTTQAVLTAPVGRMLQLYDSSLIVLCLVCTTRTPGRHPSTNASLSRSLMVGEGAGMSGGKQGSCALIEGMRESQCSEIFSYDPKLASKRNT